MRCESRLGKLVEQKHLAHAVRVSDVATRQVVICLYQKKEADSFDLFLDD